MKPIQTILTGTAITLGALTAAPNANAFCGFYVGKADTGLFNQSSQVALVRDGDRTVLTMANDYQGDLDEFAMVVPVPTVITKEQVHVSDPALMKHLDAYTAPRLVEYTDPDPCREMYLKRMESVMSAPTVAEDRSEINKALGVTIEESFSVGEYDILILSATQSDGLQTWLSDNGYKLPKGAGRTLGSYIKQDMKFFVAKVNLEKKAKEGSQMLNPIAVAYESPKFMLPIRLGTLNARGSQDLFVYALTRKGKVETTNYMTHKIPSGQELPVYIEDDFGDFYKDMYKTSVIKEGGHGVFMEYAWDMGWCDPCAADPLSHDELQELGVFWLNDNKSMPVGPGGAPRRIMPRPGADVFVTRLHVRYDAESFPDDLKFKTTGDRSNFQGRYILRHAYKGEMNCEAAAGYIDSVNKRKEKEISTLANLTGWSDKYIRGKIESSGKGEFLTPVTPPKDDSKWWNNLWGNED